MKHVHTVLRVFVGLIFFVFGINGFLHVLPTPEPVGFLPIMVASGYHSVVKVLEIVGGTLLLANRIPGLGITILTPIVVNIVLYHLFFDLTHIGPGVVLAVSLAILIWGYRAIFTPLCTLQPHVD